MRKTNKIILIVLLCIGIFFITGCGNENLNMENKIEAEIEFCESRILIFLKNSEYDEYLKDGSLDWDTIVQENSTFTNSFSTIESDLIEADIENEKLEEIKTIIQNMNTYSEKKDIDKLKYEYGNLYTKMTTVKNDKNRNFKNACIQIYMDSLNNNEEDISAKITKLEDDYKKIKQEDEFIQKNKLSVNKINDNITDIRKALNDKEYKKIRAHCLKIIEIM